MYMTTVIRVTWKDSMARSCQPMTYRNITATRYKTGWILDLPEDNNIYASLDHAKNAIDKALGGKTQRPVKKRLEKGIKIIGTK